MMETKPGMQREKHWVLHECTDDDSRAAAAAIANALDVDPAIGRLLVCRGYRTPEAARAFIGMETELLHNPFAMQDMEKAVNRVRRALRLHEKVTIYGDYDVDGVTAVCTLYLYLKKHGADVDYYIPNRMGEGYGVSRKAIDVLKKNGTRLIMTVDTGITAIEEVAYAASLGIDVVVTDHHECREELPAAAAVVNPHRPDCTYPFKELAGVGVVFKFICAYEERNSGDRRSVCVRRLCEEYADLVAIGTIADVMPILDENKLIVSFGLRKIEKTERPGLFALMAASAPNDRTRAHRPPKITSGYIGYTLAPRINAAGRIRTAERAVELFLATDKAQAEALAEELCTANRERQDEENRIMGEALEQLKENPPTPENPVIVLAADSWHHGVIGIVASRLTERFGLPAILVSFEGGDTDNPTDADVGKGSGRSIKGMNLVDALVFCSNHLVKFGGHELAAGLSVTRAELPLFREKINAYARAHLTEEAMVPVMDADCTLTGGEMTIRLCEDLRRLEPYGVGNPVPVFVMRSAFIAECVPVSGGKHTRLVLGDGAHAFTAMCFSRSQSQMDLYVGDEVDVLFNLDINEYGGRRSLQMIVRDIRLCERERREMEAARARYTAIAEGAPILPEENILPVRDDFVVVYVLLERSVRGGCDSMTHHALLSRLHSAGHRDIGYIKLKVIMHVFREMNLLRIEEFAEENYRFAVCFNDTRKKTDLEKSAWLRRLRAQVVQ